MKTSIRSLRAVALTAVLATASVSFAAIPTYSNASDSGTIEVTTTISPPLQTSVATAQVASPYGTPVITQIASGWVLTFTPNSDFFAAANNFGASEQERLLGKLSFTVTLPSAEAITANIFEDGLFNASSPTHSSVAVSGGMTVSEADDVVPVESLTNGNLAGGTTFNSLTGGWSSFLQVTGFQHAYTSYTITVDNDLLAQALADQTLDSAFIAKKHFTITLTTDGSTGAGQPPTPEPASLGIIALGGMALLARRRR